MKTPPLDNYHSNPAGHGNALDAPFLGLPKSGMYCGKVSKGITHAR